MPPPSVTPDFDAAAPPGPGELSGYLEQGGSPLTILRQLVEQYGDVVRFRTRRNVYTLFNHPRDVREVLQRHHFVRTPLIKTILGDGLLAADGPYWERQRRLMLPEFQPKRIAEMVALFVEVASARVDAWERQRPGTLFELTREMDRIALANIGLALFGVELGDDFLDAFGQVMQQLGAIGNSAVFGTPLLRKPSDHQRFQAAMRTIELAVESVAASEGESTSRGGRLLQLLRGASHGPGRTPLTAKQLRDEVVTMITAGHETTAVSLSWAWQAVLSHPEVARRFYAEVDQVLGSRPLVADDIPRLRYTRMIVDETLRLYPPVWLVARTALTADEIGGYQVPAMSGVLVSPYLLHRDPSHWKDPELFQPERFESSQHEDAYTYLPFLAGRHLCIGKHFALMEIVAVLATLGQRCRFRQLDSAAVEPDPLISLRIRGGFRVAVEKRDAVRIEPGEEA